MNLKQAWSLVKEALSSWSDDYAPSMGAALAYYTMFSIAPMLVIAIAVAGFAFGADVARTEMLSQLQGLMGEQGAQAVAGMLDSVSQPRESLAATVLGFIVLLVGATTVFAELQNALDRIWRAPQRDEGGLWALLRARLLSFGMILGIGFLLMVSLAFSAALSALGKWWAPLFGAWEVLLQVVNFVVSFGLTTTVFALIYKLIPRVDIEWRDVWIGAAVTALLFTIGKFLIGLYIGRSAVASTFGAAASMAVMLIWVYYSAQIFLMGAEFTWVYSHRLGSRRGQARPGPAQATPTRRGNGANEIDRRPGEPSPAGARPAGRAPARPLTSGRNR